MAWQSVKQSGLALICAALAACGSGGSDNPTTTPAAATPSPVVSPTPTPTPAPIAANNKVTLQVPAGLNAAPLDVPRTLTVPPGFGIRVVARVSTARFLAETPDGDLLVSQPATGKILRVALGSGSNSVNEFATGLSQGHDMVFKTLGATTWLYLSESKQITRSPWKSADTTREAATVLVGNLPDASSAELQGSYAHALKNIAVSDTNLFVSIASATNASPSDQAATPKRGAIYVYGLDGSGGRLYAQGIRNAEGLALHPQTGQLWIAVNNRDNTLYPLKDGKYPYKAVDQNYVNDNPPEPFTAVRDGGNYGWPFCNQAPDQGNTLPPLIADVQNNENQTVLDCSTVDRASKILPAHSAPLGMSFWTGSAAPDAYRNGAVIGLHGCWNCSVAHGYKVVFLAAGTQNDFADAVDLVSGFLTDPADKSTVWGRPVDVIPNRNGNLYISDDVAGAVYELYKL